jgi:flagellar assembly protein FliH
LSNVRSLPLAEKKVLIGEYAMDREIQARAETLVREAYPEIVIITSPEGKKQIPLQDIVALHEHYSGEIEQAYRRGFDEGRTQGHEAGLHQGQEEARQVVTSLSGLLSDVTAQRRSLLAEAKQRILELVLKIAQRLTFSAARIDPEVTMSIISGTIDQLLDKRRIKVKVHPDHLPELEQHIDKFRGSNTAIKEFIIEPDPRIRVGGCFIETPSGDIDARLESMYEVIRQAILDGEDETS